MSTHPLAGFGASMALVLIGYIALYVAAEITVVRNDQTLTRREIVSKSSATFYFGGVLIACVGIALVRLLG